MPPFFGSGSIELMIAAQGTRVYGYDIFSPLVEFWQCVFARSQDLAAEVEQSFPLSKTSFYELQQTQTHFNTKIKRAHWILSYNDCEQIREMYKGFHILTPNWKYGMSIDKSSKEILIFSRDFKIKEYSIY